MTNQHPVIRTMANATAIARAIAPKDHSIRSYDDPKDYAGIGFPHRMVAWHDLNGTPRSLIVAPRDR